MDNLTSLDYIEKEYLESIGLKLNKQYHMYFDESNNFRSFVLKGDKFNFDINKVFVLGGVAYKDNNKPNVKFEDLKRILNLQDNVCEIKFNKHFSRGDFMTTLNNPRVLNFLRWLDESGFYIHYIALDYFYYSIVDIIDSMNIKKICHDSMGTYYNIKSILFNALKSDEKSIFRLFSQFNFPNLGHNGEVREFLDEIIKCIEKYNIKDKDKKKLLKLLRNEKNKNRLIFIQDNEDKVLQKNLAEFYLSNIRGYKNSILHYDEELKIQEIFSNIDFSSDPNHAQFSFQDSKTEVLLQISDVVAGVISKLLSFVNKNSTTMIQEKIQQLSDSQRESLRIIRRLRIEACKENPGFLVNVMAVSEVEKLNWLLNEVGVNDAT